MQGRGGAGPDGMSVSPFQGRLLNRLPRGGSGLTGDLGGSGQFFFFRGGGRVGRLGRGGPRKPDEVSAGS